MHHILGHQPDWPISSGVFELPFAVIYHGNCRNERLGKLLGYAGQNLLGLNLRCVEGLGSRR